MGIVTVLSQAAFVLGFFICPRIESVPPGQNSVTGSQVQRSVDGSAARTTNFPVRTPPRGYGSYTEAMCRRLCQREFHACVLISMRKYICCDVRNDTCIRLMREELKLISRLGTLQRNQSTPCNPNPCFNGGDCHQGGQMKPPSYDSIGPPPYDSIPPPPYNEDTPSSDHNIPPPEHNNDLPSTYSEEMFLRFRRDPQRAFFCLCPVSYTGPLCEYNTDVVRLQNTNRCMQYCYQEHGECHLRPRIKFLIAQRRLQSLVSRALLNSFADKYLNHLYKWNDNRVCLCNSGYRGLTCKEACSPGTWGFYCLISCDGNCHKSQCNRETGECNCKVGYEFSELTATCEPDLRPGKCKKFCKSSNGQCVGDVCQCNRGDYGGHWCDTECSKFPRPRYGERCQRPCGSCVVQPCDALTGKCGLPEGGESTNQRRCYGSFVGQNCDTLPDNVAVQSIAAKFAMNQQFPTNDQEYARNWDKFFNSVTAPTRLRKEVEVGLADQLPHLFQSRVRRVVPRTNADNPTRRGTSYSRRLLASSDRTIDVECEVYAPIADVNRSNFRTTVMDGLFVLGRTFRTAVVPGLGINRNTIKLAKARLMRAGAIKQDSGDVRSSGDSYLIPLLTTTVLLFIAFTAGFVLWARVTRKKRKHTYKK